MISIRLSQVRWPTLDSTARPKRTVFIVLGLILLVPALQAGISTLVLPSLQTLQYSTRNISGFSSPDTAPQVGSANYEQLVNDPAFANALNFTQTIVGERVLITAVLPLLLALALNEFGRRTRIGMRLLFSIPMALYMPALGLIAWRLASNPQGAALLGTPNPLTSATGARTALLLIDGLQTFMVACGLGLIVYLIALRGSGDSAPTWPRVRVPLLVTWLASLGAAIAYGLQIFEEPYILTNGGPVNSTQTLGLILFRQTFQNFRFGVGAEMALILLIAVGLIGLIVGVIVIASGLRLESVPPEKPIGMGGSARSSLAILSLVVLGTIALIISVYAMLPYILALVGKLNLPGASGSPEGTIPADVLINTVLPPIVGVIAFQLPIAYVGALAIGALRPLGRRSEWLLLPFSPWLFITALSLMLPEWLNARNIGILNTLGGLTAGHAVLNVPMLFILTLFFKGQTRRWQAGESHDGASFARTVILPSLPLALALAGIAIAVGQQSLLWPLIATNSKALFTAPLAAIALQSSFSATNGIASVLAQFILPTFVIYLAGLVVFQLFVADRLAAVTGGEV